MGMDIARGGWKGAGISAGDLSDLELTLGEVPAAVRDAEHSVIFADRSEDVFQRMSKRATWAAALHQAGRRDEALPLFREAERIQAEWQSEYPRLFSLRGFQYCDLLLAGAECAAWRAAAGSAPAAACLEAVREVEERGLEMSLPRDPILDIALSHLILGRVALYRAVLEGSELAPARSEIGQVVDGLRRAGQLQYLPLGLLTRAWLRFLEGDAAGARADLDEAWETAERGPMPLHMADIHLHRARLFHDRDALAAAHGLIDKHGYGRRLEELEDAEKAAASW